MLPVVQIQGCLSISRWLALVWGQHSGLYHVASFWVRAFWREFSVFIGFTVQASIFHGFGANLLVFGVFGGPGPTKQ